MADPPDLAERLFGADPPVTNRQLWDERCAACGGVVQYPSSVPVAIEALCNNCAAGESLRVCRWWRDA
jgi:hypothetical protein